MSPDPPTLGRKAKLLTAGVVALVAIGVVLLLLRRPIRIDGASCARIQAGMTQAEVEAILGAPPGDYATGRRGIVLDLYGGGVLMREGRMEEWGGDGGFIQVGFGPDDMVLWKRFVPAGRQWTRIEKWLGRSLW